MKNVGGTPITKVKADIKPLDASGNELDSGADDYTIFYDSEHKVAPGQYHLETDDGFVLLSELYGEAKSVHVKITRVE